MYKVDCVILAAGNSTRMNTHLNKVFIEIGNKPILYYSLEKFLQHKYVNKIILVLNNKDKYYCELNLVKKFFNKCGIEIVLGGKNRQDSLFNALKYITTDYVIIHDGARPFVTEDCITKGVKYAYNYGASSCYVTPKDTIKIDKGNNNVETLDRDRLFCIQTPQCFNTAILVCAYEYIMKYNKLVTDETSALNFINKDTYFYLGDYFNIKITTREDLVFGSAILNNILGENK